MESDRREILLTAIAAIAFACLPVRGAGAAETGKPNVILILADDLGYGELGCYGNPDANTPVMDKLAEDGVRWHRWLRGLSRLLSLQGGVIDRSLPRTVRPDLRGLLRRRLS
jgi:hypothetical protein